MKGERKKLWILNYESFKNERKEYCHGKWRIRKLQESGTPLKQLLAWQKMTKVILYEHLECNKNLQNREDCLTETTIFDKKYCSIFAYLYTISSPPAQWYPKGEQTKLLVQHAGASQVLPSKWFKHIQVAAWGKRQWMVQESDHLKIFETKRLRRKVSRGTGL